MPAGGFRLFSEIVLRSGEKSGGFRRNSPRTDKIATAELGGYGVRRLHSSLKPSPPPKLLSLPPLQQRSDPVQVVGSHSPLKTLFAMQAHTPRIRRRRQHADRTCRRADSETAAVQPATETAPPEVQSGGFTLSSFHTGILLREAA